MSDEPNDPGHPDQSEPSAQGKPGLITTAVNVLVSRQLRELSIDVDIRSLLIAQAKMGQALELLVQRFAQSSSESDRDLADKMTKTLREASAEISEATARMLKRHKAG